MLGLSWKVNNVLKLYKHNLQDTWLATGCESLVTRSRHDEKQAIYSAHLFEEETLTGREALQTLDDFVDCDFWLREAGSKYHQLCGEL